MEILIYYLIYRINMVEASSERCVTGIEGLDRILNGGVPIGNTVLVTGSCGTGKTTLSVEFLVNGAKEGDVGAYIAVTESAQKVLENIKTFDFFDDELVKNKKIYFIDLGAIYKKLGLDKTEFTHEDIDVLIGGLINIVRELKIKRLVIDSITGICFQLRTKEKIRELILKLARYLSNEKCTTLLISEIPPGASAYSTYGVEDAIADGIILLGNVEQRGYMLRTLHVVKMRGTMHSRAKYVMDLTPYGIIIVPLLRTLT